MAKGSGSKKAKKGSSNVFALFAQRQIQEFKEAFGLMDADKDGLLSSSDIVAAFNSVGKSVSDGEAQGMLAEAPGPVNFTQMVMLFAEKMAGGEFAKKIVNVHQWTKLAFFKIIQIRKKDLYTTIVLHDYKFGISK